jgi:peptide/nickel transport system permease protein
MDSALPPTGLPPAVDAAPPAPKPRHTTAWMSAVYLGILTWAAAAGFPRLGALLFPDPRSDHRVHTTIALVAWAFALIGAIRLARRPAAGRRPAGFFFDLSRQFTKNRAAVIGLHLGLVLALFALVTPLIAPFDPDSISVGPLKDAPSLAHLFGTDRLGRDVFSRCLFGARISLSIGFVAVSISATVGTLVGASAGFFGGAIDRVLMWVTDLMMSLPRLVLLLAIVGVIPKGGGRDLPVLIVILGATGWMGVARIVRAQILSLREQDFVSAGRALGIPPLRLLVRHLVPNALAPVIVYASLALGGTILTEAGLSFLGLGVAPPTATWGSLVADGREDAINAPWVSVFPGLLIVCAVMAFNLLGDGLRDALDPKLRGRS